GVPVPRGGGNRDPRRRPGRAGARGGGPRPAAPGLDRLAGHGRLRDVDVGTGRAGGGAGQGRAGRGRAHRGGRGAGLRPGQGGTFLRSGAVSASGGVAAPAVEGPTAAAGRGGSLFPPGPRCGPATASEVLGTAGGDELEPPVPAARPAGRSPTAAGPDLRLVHRRACNPPLGKSPG